MVSPATKPSATTAAATAPLRDAFVSNAAPNKRRPDDEDEDEEDEEEDEDEEDEDDKKKTDEDNNKEKKRQELVKAYLTDPIFLIHDPDDQKKEEAMGAVRLLEGADFFQFSGTRTYDFVLQKAAAYGHRKLQENVDSHRHYLELLRLRKLVMEIGLIPKQALKEPTKMPKGDEQAKSVSLLDKIATYTTSPIFRIRDERDYADAERKGGKRLVRNAWYFQFPGKQTNEFVISMSAINGNKVEEKTVDHYLEGQQKKQIQKLYNQAVKTSNDNNASRKAGVPTAKSGGPHKPAPKSHGRRGGRGGRKHRESGGRRPF